MKDRKVTLKLRAVLELPRSPAERRALKRLARAGRDLASLNDTDLDPSDVADLVTHFESIVQTMRRARASRHHRR